MFFIHKKYLYIKTFIILILLRDFLLPTQNDKRRSLWPLQLKKRIVQKSYKNIYIWLDWLFFDN